MFNRRGGTPTRFHAHISKDWDQNIPATYDPDYVWERTLSSPEDAVEAIRSSASQVIRGTPWAQGHLLCIMHLGPRGGVYKVTLERTQDHPTLDAALDALAARQ